MIRLKNKYKGKAAVSIMGGSSILQNGFDLSLIDKNKYTVFLESKALTPQFLEFGLKPDFFLMLFPEKCKTNSLQHVMLQSFIMNIDLSNLLRTEHLEEYYRYRDNFNDYFEPWSAEKGLHKKYKFKNNIILDNSPWKLLENLSDVDVVSYDGDDAQRSFGPDIGRLANNKYLYYGRPTKENFDFDKYFNPEDTDEGVRLNLYGHVNSSAISLYPLLNYMGFEKIYFIGMDMSLLGSMEYAANYTFKSMSHFNTFFNAAREAYSYDFPRGIKNGLKYFGASTINNLKNKKYSSEVFKNLFWDIWGLKGKFIRDRKQFVDCRDLFSYDKIEFVNIYEPFKYARPVPGIRNISYKDFIANQ